ncbi:MAG: cupin domain-containing protein [Terricaulis sp.]
MATARETLAGVFFGGDGEAARCLFEATSDDAALHVQGGAQRNPLISIDWWPYIARVLDNGDLGPFEFDVIQGGTAIHARGFLDTKSNPSSEAITNAVNQGASLRVFGVSRFEPHCAAHLQLLRRVLQREAFVNLYVTPAGSPGLKVHYDLEDSLVVQVKGEKIWKLYNATSAIRYPRELPSAPLTVSSEPSQIIHMRAGDVLFVPSGLVHTVETRESSSQHITFGLHVSRQVTLLSALLEQFAATEEDLRRPVRTGETVSRDALAAWAARFQRWLTPG